jgi:uncharacterized membrane protein YhaH (DUF805 family)
MNIGYLMFGFGGRISRLPYWIGSAIIIILSLALTYALAPLMGLSPGDLMAQQRSPQAVRLDILTNLIIAWPELAIMTKRLHDRGRSGVWAVLFYVLFAIVSLVELLGLSGTSENPTMIFLIPALAMGVIALWLIIELGFFRGTKGDNAYGPDPLGEDK